jgi:hypothetical protein
LLKGKKMDNSLLEVRKQRIEEALTGLLTDLMEGDLGSTPLAYQVSAAIAGLNLTTDGSVDYENYKQALQDGPQKPNLTVVSD